VSQKKTEPVLLRETLANLVAINNLTLQISQGSACTYLGEMGILGTVLLRV